MLPLPSRCSSRAASKKLRWAAQTCTQRRTRVTLAYEVHEPPASARKRYPPGAPIIFMHGLFGSKRNNRSISKVLARDLNRTVYALDLRNHGESPHDSQHDYTSMAEDVEGFMDEHKLEQPTLIGHSMGAKTAMTIALRSPDRVETLIPVDNAPVDAALKSDFGKYVEGMQKIAAAKVKKQSEADNILFAYEESLPIRQFLLTNMVRSEDGSHLQFRIPLRTLAGALDNMADFPFKDPDQVQFKKPTLIVRGSESRYVSDETLPIIGRFFPRFQLADVQGAGHWVISEKPEEFRRAVVEFLQPKE